MLTEYRMKQNGLVLSLQEYRDSHPNFSIPDGQVNGEDADVVIQTPEPTVTSTQSVTRNGIEQNADGNWQWAWQITDWPQERIDKCIADTRLLKTNQIKAERDRRKFNGVHVGTHWIHSDTFSRTQWLGMLMAGSALPSVPWSTMDGTFVMTSSTLAQQVFQGVMTLDATLFGIGTAKIAAMNALADPSAYDPTTGWPLTFGE